VSKGESRFLTAQLGYIVSFTLVHAGKYNTEDKLKKTESTWPRQISRGSKR